MQATAIAGVTASERAGTPIMALPEGNSVVGYHGFQQMLWAVEGAAVPSAAGAPGRALEWATTEGHGPLRLVCAPARRGAGPSPSRSRVAWDCSLKCDVYPSQGSIQTWNR